MIAAELAATLSATATRGPKVTRSAPVPALASPAPDAGEPQLPPDPSIALGARAAADRFVRDYVLWSDRQLAAIPAADGTHRVIRLLARHPSANRLIASDAVDSIRIAAVAPKRYVATSIISNVLLGKRRSRWVVVSLPGD